jgi:hypothetical protein
MLTGALPFEPWGEGSAGGVFVGSPFGGGMSPAGDVESCGASAGGMSSGVLGAFWSEPQAAHKQAIPRMALDKPWRNCRRWDMDRLSAMHVPTRSDAASPRKRAFRSEADKTGRYFGAAGGALRIKAWLQR